MRRYLSGGAICRAATRGRCMSYRVLPVEGGPGTWSRRETKLGLKPCVCGLKPFSYPIPSCFQQTVVARCGHPGRLENGRHSTKFTNLTMPLSIEVCFAKRVGLSTQVGPAKILPNAGTALSRHIWFLSEHALFLLCNLYRCFARGEKKY